MNSYKLYLTRDELRFTENGEDYLPLAKKYYAYALENLMENHYSVVDALQIDFVKVLLFYKHLAKGKVQ